MTSEQRAALREAASKATPGPWVHDPTGGICGRRFATCIWGEYGPGHGAIADASPFSAANEQNLQDARYIALAHPAAVLALLDALDAAERNALQPHEIVRRAANILEEDGGYAGTRGMLPGQLRYEADRLARAALGDGA